MRPAAPPPTELKPIARTHSIPPYPTISQRLGEQGTVTLKVTIGTDGSVTEDSIEKTSGSDRLDQAALRIREGALEMAAADHQWTAGTGATTLVAVNSTSKTLSNTQTNQFFAFSTE